MTTAEAKQILEHAQEASNITDEAVLAAREGDDATAIIQIASAMTMVLRCIVAIVDAAELDRSKP